MKEIFIKQFWTNEENSNSFTQNCSKIMLSKDETWDMIESFHADSFIKRILEVVTFHEETTCDQVPIQMSLIFKLDWEREEVQIKHSLKSKREYCSMFQYSWRNIYCFDFIFIAHNTGILGHKVTLQSHIRYTHFKNAFPLAVLHFKRWIGSCGYLNLVWFGLWIFWVCQWYWGSFQNALF